MQLYRILLYAAKRAMPVVPMSSGMKKIQTSINIHKNIMQDRSQNQLQLTMKMWQFRTNTCSESPHLRKAEKDCKRVQMYWPPTVAMQYHNFWAAVSPGPSKPVLTAGTHTSIRHDFDSVLKFIQRVIPFEWQMNQNKNI